ncbi:hypothetical protein PQR75_10150 [Paraburkholderia fungorum]|uniref:hypothetical protein n=1 Tax=Paraburkholderia fungorum TaxID=134537 RepID=UPI0038BAFDF8
MRLGKLHARLAERSVFDCNIAPLPLRKLFSKVKFTVVPAPMSSVPIKPQRDGTGLPPANW